MIEARQIQVIAKDHLKTVLFNYPSIYRRLVIIPEFKIWSTLCEVRTKEMIEAKFIRSKFAMNDFVKKAAVAYAKKRLEEWDLKLNKA